MTKNVSKNMTETVLFEDCTNGIFWKVQENKNDDKHAAALVFHDDEKNEGIGNYILENVKDVLDAELCNRAKITITIEAIED